jgi:hypothetical protein
VGISASCASIALFYWSCQRIIFKGTWRRWAIALNDGGKLMKYLIEYTVRTAGLSFDQNFAGSEALLTAFSKWKPDDEKGLTIHAFVSNLAGRGGYILVETNDGYYRLCRKVQFLELCEHYSCSRYRGVGTNKRKFAWVGKASL